MISELEHMYRDRYPVSIIVELTEENWADVAEWSKALTNVDYEGDEDDQAEGLIIVPNGDWDDVYVRLGDRLVKTGPYWLAFTTEEWGTPGETGAICDEYVPIGGPPSADDVAAPA